MNDVIQISQPIDDEAAMLLMLDRLREQRDRIKEESSETELLNKSEPAESEAVPAPSPETVAPIDGADPSEPA